MLDAYGIDLGLASVATAYVKDAEDGALPHVAGVRLITTSKGHAKGLRVSEDDARRLLEIQSEVVASLERIRPGLVAYEEYRVYDDRTADSLRKAARDLLAGLGWVAPGYGVKGFAMGMLDAVAKEQGVSIADACAAISESLKGASNTMGRGSAAKVLGVQAMVVIECARLDIPSIPFSPVDRCVHMLGREKGSKEDIIEAVYRQTTGFEAAIQAKGYAQGAVNHLADAVAHALTGIAYRKRGNRRR